MPDTSARDAQRARLEAEVEEAKAELQRRRATPAHVEELVRSALRRPVCVEVGHRAVIAPQKRELANVTGRVVHEEAQLRTERHELSHELRELHRARFAHRRATQSGRSQQRVMEITVAVPGGHADESDDGKQQGPHPSTSVFVVPLPPNEEEEDEKKQLTAGPVASDAETVTPVVEATATRPVDAVMGRLVSLEAAVRSASACLAVLGKSMLPPAQRASSDSPGGAAVAAASPTTPPEHASFVRRPLMIREQPSIAAAAAVIPVAATTADASVTTVTPAAPDAHSAVAASPVPGSEPAVAPGASNVELGRSSRRRTRPLRAPVPPPVATAAAVAGMEAKVNERHARLTALSATLSAHRQQQDSDRRVIMAGEQTPLQHAGRDVKARLQRLPTRSGSRTR